MKDSEGNEEMKQALESVVQEIIKKDTLYEPMKAMRDEYPKWLEANWDKVSQEDLERYNKQLDKIVEICAVYEAKEGATVEVGADGKPQDDGKVFELLAQLQELGTPPQDLMKKIGDPFGGAGAQGNPFAGL